MTTRLPLAGWIALLLAIAAAALAAMVVLDDDLGIALAVVTVVAAVTCLVAVVRDEINDDGPSTVRHSRPSRFGLIFTAVAMVTLIVAVGVDRLNGRDAATASGTPLAAVDAARAYMASATVDQNGEQACGYLTGSEEARMAGLAGAQDCRSAIDGAGTPAPGVPGTSDAIKHLPVKTTARDGRVTVVLGRAPHRFTFDLRRATEPEIAASFSPDSAWRISSGATSVVRQ